MSDSLYNKKKIEKCITHSYVLQNGNFISEGKIINIKTYDAGGNLIEEKDYQVGNSKTVYKYDEKSNLISSSSFYFDTLTKSVLYEYNQKNNLIEKSARYTNDNSPYKYSYFYDGNNNLTEEVYLESNERLIRKKSFLYDVNNKLTKIIESVGTDTQSVKSFTYNDFGKKVEENTFYYDYSQHENTTFIYDELWNCIESVFTIDTDPPVKIAIHYYYNDEAILNRKVQTHYLYDYITGKDMSIFDEEGKITETIFFNRDNIQEYILKYVYEYFK
jgi:hypothetical protein